MAEKEPELQTREEQIAHAKELYGRGYRNYVVGDFNEAAEDLSRSCELYATLYGDESEEVLILYTYLLYGWIINFHLLHYFNRLPFPTCFMERL